MWLRKHHETVFESNLDVTILDIFLITSEQKQHLVIFFMKVDIVIIFLLRTHCTHSTFNISRIPVWFENILILNLFSQTMLCLNVYRLSIYIRDSIIICLIFFSRTRNISMVCKFLSEHSVRELFHLWV